MAGSLNRVQLIGHLGQDPEIRRTQDGRPIANFTLATTESWKDKNTGERKEQTDWHRCVCFNEGLCKVIEQYIKKGDKIYLEGALKTRKWTDKSGTERYTTEVVLRAYNGQILMLSNKRAGEGQASGASGGAKSAATSGNAQEPPPNDGAGGAGNDMDDEVPF